jgi:hypothetical protein
MQRRTQLKTTYKTISKIVLTTRNASIALAGGLEIWLSEDNWKYKCYDGPRHISCKDNQIIVTDLAISSPFIALRINDPSDRKNIFNTFSELITIFDASGHVLPFTYGIVPRTYRGFSKNHLECAVDAGGGFMEEGLLFDYQEGIPSAVWNADQISHRYLDFAYNKEGVIGIALGQNNFVPGCLSPSEPEAVNYWLKIIDRALNCGVDGVDIRAQNHCNVLTWPEYGFNTPAVEEYKKRYGIDPRLEKYDRCSWQQLQGEFYTRFLKAAKQKIHERGQKILLHIEDMMEGTPDAPTPMNVYWDWQHWLDEGIADEVIYKAITVDSYRSHMGRMLLTICREKNIPVHYCPFIHSWLQQKPEVWKQALRDLQQSGMNGLIVYENATIYSSWQDGSIKNLYPDFVEFLQQCQRTNK